MTIFAKIRGVFIKKLQTIKYVTDFKGVDFKERQ